MNEPFAIAHGGWRDQACDHDAVKPVMTIGSRRPRPARDDRHRLRKAQLAHGHATQAAQRVLPVAERAQEGVDRAQGLLVAYGDVEADIARVRAAAIRSGADAAVPAELATRRQQQQRAREEVEDAQRAFAVLADEARDVQHAAAQAHAALTVAIDVVLQTEASAIIVEMRAAEAKAAGLRVLADAFLDSRFGSDPPIVDHDLAVLRHDTLHGPMIATALRLRVQVDGQIWNRLAAALATDAAAEMPW